jgi:hypothetical protein
MFFLQYIVDKQKRMLYNINKEIDSEFLNTLDDEEKEYYMLNKDVPYGWVSQLPVDTASENTRFKQGNDRAVVAVNKLLRFDPLTGNIDTQNVKFVDLNNNIKKTKESDIYKLNEHGQRISKRGSDYTFYLYDYEKNNNNSAVVIFLDGNVNNINSATFASFYYKGIGFKEKVDPNMSSSVLGVFKHLSKTKKGLKEPYTKEEAFVTVLTLLKKPYTNKKGQVIRYQKKLMYIDDSKKELMRDLQDIVVDKNNGDFKGLMVKLCKIDGEYRQLAIEPEDLPIEIFGEKGKKWLNGELTKNSGSQNGGYYVILKANVKTATGIEHQDYVDKLFIKPEHELRNAKGEIYQSSDYFATPFDYNEIMSDGNFERIKAFYGKLEATMVTLPDGSSEPTGDLELLPGKLQRLVDGSPRTRQVVPSNTPNQSYTQPTENMVEENPFQQQPTSGLLGNLVYNNAPQETQVSGVEKLNTKPGESIPPPLIIEEDMYLTEDDLPF